MLVYAMQNMMCYPRIGIFVMSGQDKYEDRAVEPENTDKRAGTRFKN